MSQNWAPALLHPKPFGVLICATPCHCYLKNLALALNGKFDAHFTDLWDGSHCEAGIELLNFRFRRAGRGCGSRY